MTFAPAAAAAFSIVSDEPASSETRMTTLAPFARHWSACVFWRWASPLALLITYVTLARLKAVTSAGRSCVSHRTDDLGSGSRAQIDALAFELDVLPCATVVAVPAIATSARPITGMSFFTPVPFVRTCTSLRRDAHMGGRQHNTERLG